MFNKGKGLRILLWIGLLSAGPAWAQGPPVPLARVPAVRDSIARLLAAHPQPDTLRVTRLNGLAFLLRNSEAPAAERLGRQALALARRLRFDRGLTEAYFNTGYFLRTHSQYDSAIYYSRQALAASVRTGNRYTQTRAYYNLARIYTEQGDYAAALDPSLDGLALARTMHSPRVLLFQLVQAARIEIALGDYATATTYLTEARPLIPAAHDPLGTGYVHIGLGDISRAQGRWRAARRDYATAAASYAHVFNAQAMLPVELSQAEMTDRLGDHLAARRAAAGLLRRLRGSKMPEQLAQTTLLLAQTWLATARPDSARRYATLSLAAARPAHLRAQARAAALALAQASDQLGEGRAAYRYQVLAGAYADSIAGEDARRRAAALQAQATRGQQQTQIRLLTQQGRLQSQQQELERLRNHQQIAGLAALVAGGLALAGYLLWRYRRREARRQEALRTRIAADLHDEVGSMLTQISMQSTLLRENRYAPAQQQTYLDQMAEASRRAARQMSDAVWSIDARYDSAASLLDRLRDHAHEVLPPAGLELSFRAEAGIETLALPLAIRQALYYIYKEALHNVVKHARAQHVQVWVRRLPQQLELEVRDDGQGLPAPGRPGGQGLRNMQMRATAVGGSLSLAPAGPGTTLVARLPLK